VRGFLAAAILANVETYLDAYTSSQLPLGQRFDLIAGTSAGGLIALGLALGRSAAELRQLFVDFRIARPSARGPRRSPPRLALVSPRRQS
jgi:patatin-like phospholipase/acyl hydrolase